VPTARPNVRIPLFTTNIDPDSDWGTALFSVNKNN